MRKKTATIRHFTHAKATAAALHYFNGDGLAASVWVQKYALRDAKGCFYESTPDDMHRRLAREFARVEQKYPNPLPEETIYGLLKDFRYVVPQGSPMAGIGNPYQIISLSNCFVIAGPEDSYGSILHTDEEQVQLMKRRGGVGHDLSGLRPKGSPVSNSASTSPGIVPFMERYAHTTREVAQGGRRGALMLTLSVSHPDVEDFIAAKMEPGVMPGVNLSVRLDDAFMRAALGGKPYRQQFPVDTARPQRKRMMDAAALWQKIVYNAWKSAEPGVLFWDTVLRESVADCYADLGYRTVSTNPCGEVPLCAYDSCRLVALNLYSYVENPFRPAARFDMEIFAGHVRLAQRLCDDLVDLEIEKIEQILEKIASDPEPEEMKHTEYALWQKVFKTCCEARRCGLGITGAGDMLAALGLRYGSPAATRKMTEVQRVLALEAYRSSVVLARERGAFPIYETGREAKTPFIRRLQKADPQLYRDMQQYGRRNIALLTIAPTGTTSLMTRTSSGIEPAFSVAYQRRRKADPDDPDARVAFVDENGDSWEDYAVFHHKFAEWLRVHGHDPEKTALLPPAELQTIVETSPYHRATAADVDWLQKVKMQGAVQQWVDHAISTTVNIPEDTPLDMVEKIYRTAWESGCKGCTIYREGTREGVLVRR